jgi:uncharacterized protein (DUF1810 family)
MSDEFDLQRFVEAQNPVFETVMDELCGGRKQSHWMWFIFPQLRGLGSSTMATFFGLVSVAEAQAYLAHSVLGPRLEVCTRAVLDIRDRPLAAIFGSPDGLKFRSSMTLFSIAAHESGSVFNQALERLCDGVDERTLTLIGRETQVEAL